MDTVVVAALSAPTATGGAVTPVAEAVVQR